MSDEAKSRCGVCGSESRDERFLVNYLGGESEPVPCEAGWHDEDEPSTA